MDEQSSSPRSALLKLILALLPGFLLVWLLQRKKKTLAPQSSQPDIQTLQLENERLKQQLGALKAAPEPVGMARNFDGSPENIKRIALKSVLTLAGAAMLLIPPILVVSERWFNNPTVRDSMRNAWCRTDWLCETQLPSYFLLVIPFFLAIILIFFAFAPAYPQIFSGELANNPPAQMPSKPGKRQILASNLLRLAAMLGAGVLLYFGVTIKRVPGAELFLIIVVYILGQYLDFYPIDNWRAAWRRMPAWALPVVLTQIALVLFLQSAYSQSETFWLCAVLLFLALLYLWKYRQQFSPVVWVMMLGLLLYSWQMDSWRFSVIGDDYAFFGYARSIINEQSLADIFRNMFMGEAVYGSHPYFSSLIQVFFMKILGTNSFGWRFSSIFLTALSLVFFYQFYKRFVNARIALVTVILLAASQYLMGFGKIGYNNLQALFVMGVVMWRAGVAVQTRHLLDYSWLGLAAGLCFYVYPAALYLLPLVVVFLLFYDLPITRAAAGRWVMVASALFLMMLPVFVQPGYWQAKIAGTFIYTPGVVGDEGLGMHLVTNFLYSIFSYLFIASETHFVVGSYLDPLSAVFVPLGIAWLVKLYKKERFARFSLVGFLVLLILVGTTHDRGTPSNTRMFLLLPFFMLFVSLGLQWLAESVNRLARSKILGQIMLVILVVGMVGLNIYQTYGVARQRTTGTPSLEMLFLRLMQRNQQINIGDDYTYMFITSPDWGIDGIKEIQAAYQLPPSAAQLQRYETSSTYLTTDLLRRVDESKLIVLIDPFMGQAQNEPIVDALLARGRVECPLKDTPSTQMVILMLLHPDDKNICPVEGNWDLPPK